MPSLNLLPDERHRIIRKRLSLGERVLAVDDDSAPGLFIVQGSGDDPGLAPADPPRLGPLLMEHAVELRLREVVEGTARLHGAKVAFTYKRDYPVTRNHERQTAFAASVAAQVAGRERVDDQVAPVMGAEDFSFMLEARPGAFIFVGNGGSAGLHHPAYDFNDEVIPIGTSYWVKLVETALPG